MRNSCWHDGDYSRLVRECFTGIDTGTASGNNFMGFKLCLMDMIFDTFGWGNTHQMVAVCAMGILGSHNVF